MEVQGQRGTEGLFVSTEGVILWAMVAAGLGLTLREGGSKVEGGRELTSASSLDGKKEVVLKGQVWKYTPAGESDVNASPVVAGNQVYIGIIHGAFFERTGRVHCLDRDSVP